MFSMFRVISIKETGHLSLHFDAKSAVEVNLTLVKGSYPHSYLHTHIVRNIYKVKPGLMADIR